MTPEGKFKKKVCSKLRKLGCTVLQYTQGVGTVKGFPDTIVLLPEGLTIFIEFKASKRAKFQPLQKEWIKKLTDRQYFAYIMYPENEEEIMAEIRRLL
jgi:Holliday junction resolvase